MKGTRGLGSAGERVALDYLRQKGYELLETNWRCPGGELDLILTHGEAVVFVEVRTRRGERAGSPEESVTRAKQDRLRSLAAVWLSEQYPDSEPPKCRIDVVAVHLSTDGRLVGVNQLVSAV